MAWRVARRGVPRHGTLCRRMLSPVWTPALLGVPLDGRIALSTSALVVVPNARRSFVRCTGLEHAFQHLAAPALTVAKTVRQAAGSGGHLLAKRLSRNPPRTSAPRSTRPAGLHPGVHAQPMISLPPSTSATWSRWLEGG